MRKSVCMHVLDNNFISQGRSIVNQSVRMMYVCRGGRGSDWTGLRSTGGYNYPTQTNNDAYYMMIASMTFPIPKGLLVYGQITY
mgnify:CR=1 FL=1